MVARMFALVALASLLAVSSATAPPRCPNATDWACSSCDQTVNATYTSPYILKMGGNTAVLQSCYDCVNNASPSNIWVCTSCISTPPAMGNPNKANSPSLLWDTQINITRTCHTCATGAGSATPTATSTTMGYACPQSCKAVSYSNIEMQMCVNCLNNRTNPQDAGYGCFNCMATAQQLNNAAHLKWPEVVSRTNAIAKFRANCLACVVTAGNTQYECVQNATLAYQASLPPPSPPKLG